MYKLAVLGTGFIANIFMQISADIESLAVEAVLDITDEGAKEFAEKHGIPLSFSNYDELLANKEIQFVYVALPNHLHYPFAKKALESGKNVIIEKPFVSNVAEIDDLLNVAKQNQVMIFDAITTKYVPLLDDIKHNLNKVGEVKNVTSSYCQYSSKYNQVKAGIIPSVFDLKKDGGVLKDLGIYPITFHISLFGKPTNVKYYANKLENGCDTSGVLIMEYPGFITTSRIAKDSFTENRCTIEGTTGTMFIDDDCFRFPNLRFKQSKEDSSHLLGEFQTMGLVNEFNYFFKVYHNQDFEKCYDLIEQTKVVVQTLNDAADSANIVYG